MKNIMLIIALIVIAFILSAMSPADTREAAVVIRDGGCNLILADGSIGFLAARKDVRVYTSGPKMRMCQGRIANSSGKTIHYNASNTGLLCEVYGEATSVWRETISASGAVSLFCRLR